MEKDEKKRAKMQNKRKHSLEESLSSSSFTKKTDTEGNGSKGKANLLLFQRERERESLILTLPFAGLNETRKGRAYWERSAVGEWPGNDRTSYWVKRIIVTGWVLYGRNEGRKVKGRRSYDSGAWGHLVIVVAGPPWRSLVWRWKWKWKWEVSLS